LAIKRKTRPAPLRHIETSPHLPDAADAVVIGRGIVEGVRAGHETLHRSRLDQPTPMERTRILDPAPDRNTVQLTHQRALDLLPELKRTKVTASWAGYIGVPAIGEISHLPGLILAAGFNGHGFGLGPGADHLIADLVTGTAPIVDPLPHDPGRFFVFRVGKVADF
jgi:glycine/D-amino acid oxidase-like deaminating enzyme